MVHSTESVINGGIDVIPEESGAFVELWFTEHSAAVYVPHESGLILVEESEYSPSDTLRLGEMEEGRLAPFHTYGEQLLVDFNTSTYSSKDIYFEEGSVQGLVYALHAIRYGGDLSQEAYERMIVGWATNFSEESIKYCRDLSHTAISNFVDLGYIRQEAERV